jgi:hypothetical protein
MNECQVLWCKMTDLMSTEHESQCVTTNIKWVDGTPCGIHTTGNVKLMFNS